MTTLEALPPIREAAGASASPGLHAGEIITPGRRVMRHGEADWLEDQLQLVAGVLDPASFAAGWTPASNTVEVVVRRADGTVKAIRRQHNIRTTQGRDQWQRVLMSGDVSGLDGLTGTATASSATTLTNTGAAFPTATSAAGNAGLQGKIVIANTTTAWVAGVILSNTATVLTVDQWYAIPFTGAAGTTPAATANYCVLPHGMWLPWVFLSTDATTPAAGDVCRTADGLFGNGGAASTATEQTANGLARAYLQATFPSAGEYQFVHQWTYTGASSVVLAKVGACNSLAAAGTLLGFDTLLNATATLNASGDSVTVTYSWTL